jgi:hypothetical protein
MIYRKFWGDIRYSRGEACIGLTSLPTYIDPSN